MEIDDDVPPPVVRGYPFKNMAPGQSVLCAGETTAGRAYNAAQAVARRRGWKFSARREGDGIRIWRIK